MYRLISNGQEYRQSNDLASLESLLDRLTARLVVIQEYIPGFGWRDLP